MPRRPDRFATVETHKFQRVCKTFMLRLARENPLLSRVTARRLVVEINRRYSAKVRFLKNVARDLERGVVDLDDLILALSIVCPHYADLGIKGDVKRLKARLYGCVSGGLKANENLIRALRKILSENPPHTILRKAFFAQWLRLIDDETIRWVVVERVEKTGKRETGYDLTVPGSETFANESGVILSNTMNVHVPATRDAVKEAVDVLMPSKMLFTIRDPEKVMPLPKHEHVLGLHNAQARPAAQKVRFATEQEFERAFEQGKVAPNDEIEIGGSTSLPGGVS